MTTMNVIDIDTARPTFTAVLEPIWKPTTTQGYTYRVTWTLPDGSVHSLTHRNPEREVCREIARTYDGDAKVIFIDGKTRKPRITFSSAKGAAGFVVEERPSEGLRVVRYRPGPSTSEETVNLNSLSKCA